MPDPLVSQLHTASPTQAQAVNRLHLQQLQACLATDGATTLSDHLRKRFAELNEHTPQVVLGHAPVGHGEEWESWSPYKSTHIDDPAIHWVPGRSIVEGGGERGWGSFSYRPENVLLVAERDLEACAIPDDIGTIPVSQWKTKAGCVYRLGGDGNHRLAAYRALAIPWVPVRIGAIYVVDGAISIVTKAHRPGGTVRHPQSWLDRLLRRPGPVVRAPDEVIDRPWAKSILAQWNALLDNGSITGGISSSVKGRLHVATLTLDPSCTEPWLAPGLDGLEAGLRAAGHIL